MPFIVSFLIVFAILFTHPFPGHAQGRAERAIEKNDTNGDGKISPDEFPREPRVFKRLDRDGDGFITLEEFRAGFSSPSGGSSGGGRRHRKEGRVATHRASNKFQDSGRDRVHRDFSHMDVDGDGKISRAEWNRRGNFHRLDTDGNGYLNLNEVRAHYRRSAVVHRPESPGEAPGPIGGTSDIAALAARVPSGDLRRTTSCGMVRGRGCAPRNAVDIGMIATGLGPTFPDGLHCHAIDDYWAMDYSFKRHRQVRHGGIDLPADWGTPILAAADGTVVAVFEGKDSARGKEVILRHAPHQTGLPFWTYTGYAHLDVLPPFKPGQRVKKGQVLGPTGNSGIGGMSRRQNTRRRAAVHFSVVYSDRPEYAIIDDVVVPVNGLWMDPVGFYRSKPPWESSALKALPEKDKYVAVPVMGDDGRFFPHDTKLIWPYACTRE